MCFDFVKMAPKIKVQTFLFGVHVLLFVSGKLGEIWAKMVLEVCFDFKRIHPT